MCNHPASLKTPHDTLLVNVNCILTSTFNKASCLLPNFPPKSRSQRKLCITILSPQVFYFAFFETFLILFSFFLISCCFAKSCYFEYFEMPRELFVDSFRGEKIYCQRITIQFDYCEGEEFLLDAETLQLTMK